MRALFAIFLCLTLAFQGIASARTFEQACSMKSGKSGMAMGHSATASDCCNDADTAAKTGEPCKTAQTCSPSGAFVGMSFKTEALPPAPSPLVMTGVFFLPSSDLSSIWRPPTLG